MIRIRSDKARKIAVDYLKEEHQDVLRVWAAFAKATGKPEEIQLEFDDDELLNRLEGK